MANTDPRAYVERETRCPETCASCPYRKRAAGAAACGGGVAAAHATVVRAHTDARGLARVLANGP